MKRMLTFLGICCLCGGLYAQETVPPKFQGSDVQRYVACLTGEAEKIVLETDTPAGELTAHVAVGFQVDTTGVVTEWRFLDNTCEGKDRRELEPASVRTREVLTEAAGRLENWTPAVRNGRSVPFTYRLSLRLPVEKIAKKQDGSPLRFAGEDPEKSFHPWATTRTHYDARFTARGVEGMVHVRFYIEPDGAVTIGEVIASPDAKLSKEVVRVIKSSKGKWTPRKDRNGVPLRTAYEYRVNFHNN